MEGPGSGHSSPSLLHFHDRGGHLHPTAVCHVVSAPSTQLSTILTPTRTESGSSFLCLLGVPGPFPSRAASFDEQLWHHLSQSLHLPRALMIKSSPASNTLGKYYLLISLPVSDSVKCFPYKKPPSFNNSAIRNVLFYR